MGPKWEHRPPPKRVSKALQQHRYARAKNTCKEKRRFDNEKSAQLEVQRIKNQRRGFSRPYKCRLCAGWHLTSQREREGLPVKIELRTLPASLEHRRVKIRELLEHQASLGVIGLMLPIPHTIYDELDLDKYRFEVSWNSDADTATFDIYEKQPPIDLDTRPW